MAHLQQQMCLTVDGLGNGQGLIVVCRSSRCKGPSIGAATQQLRHVYAPPAIIIMQT